MTKTTPSTRRTPTEEEMYKFGAVGCGMASMAAYFGFSTQTFYEYINQRPSLWHALKKGEFESNVTVQSKAYEMAVSGDHPTMTMFWLKTRCGFREEPIFAFITQRFGVKEPKNLNPEQMEEVYQTACSVLKEREGMRMIEAGKRNIKRKRKKIENLEHHLRDLKEREEENG